MNYNLQQFTGEISPQLSSFKIPMKTEPKSVEVGTAADGVSSATPSNGYSTPMNYYKETQKPTQPSLPSTNLKRSLPPANGAQDAIDAGAKDKLPKELTKLFLPLFCELCGVHSNSVISAKMHYDSKCHDKKIDAWLLKWSQETGEPIPKRAKANDGPSGPNAFHCHACDLPLTSQLNANQHYMGKKHQSVIKGRANPNGSGYYGTDGKWIRTTTNPAVDLSGRFNIGKSFVPASTPAPAVTPIVNQNPDVFCAICNISVSAKNEMTMHLAGNRHAKRLRANGSAPFTPNPPDTIMQSVQATAGSDQAPTTGQMQRDTSINRTPSGQFYCKTCNVTVSSEIPFKQHLESKKHRKLNQ